MFFATTLLLKSASAPDAALIDLACPPSLDTTTRSWVYEALPEITNEHLGDDPTAGKNWFSTQGAKRREEFKRGEQWSVLGNH